MDSTFAKPSDESIHLLTTFMEAETTIMEDQDSSDTIITINGVYSNSKGTWIVLATNVGFAVFEARKSIRFLKQSAHALFEVR